MKTQNIKKFVAILVAFGCITTSTRIRADESAEAVVKTRPAIESVRFQTLAIGAQSGCDKPAKMLITSPQEWQRVWNVHSKTLSPQSSAQSALPDVDFSRQAVVVLLSGAVKTEAKPQNPLIEISQVVRTPSETVVFFTQEKPARAVGKLKVASSPFHFAVIEKPATPVRFSNVFAERCETCVVGK